VIENRGSAGTTLGVGAVVRAEPDGYTILATSSAHTIAPWIVPNVSYDTAKDLTGALMISQNANVLIVLPSMGWKTARDLVAAAKAKPGLTRFVPFGLRLPPRGGSIS
jgi:tripartite-type tricarboxylate transporter receptor subunit TctC